MEMKEVKEKIVREEGGYRRNSQDYVETHINCMTFHKF